MTDLVPTFPTHAEAIGALTSLGPELARLRDELLRATYEVQEDLKAIEAFEIDDQAALDLARGTTAQLKEQFKALEKSKESLTKPFNAILKKIHDAYRPAFTNFEKGERILKTKMTAALKRLKEEQTKALQAVSAAAREGDLAKAREAMVAAPTANMPEKMSVTEKWKFRVLDGTKIPDEYLMVVLNETAVKNAIAAGVREISGLEIYSEDIVAIRR